MKKLLFIFAALFAMAAVVAPTQNATAQKITMFGGNGKSLDTLTNTTTEYLTTGTNALNSTGLSGNYNIQVVLYCISSTSGACTGVLESSIDGINYTNHFKVAGTNGVLCDTIAFGTLSSSTTYTHIWSIPSNSATATQLYSTSASNATHTNAGRRLYFRVRLIPTNTQSTKYSGYLLAQN